MAVSAEGTHSIVFPLREAALTAVIAAALMLPMIGIFTVSRGGALIVETRLPELALSVLLVFLGRLGLIYARDGKPALSGGLGIAVALAGWLGLIPGDLLKVIAIGGGALLAVRAVMATDAGKVLGQKFSWRNGQSDKAGGSVFTRRGPWIGAALIVFALALPWLPSALRRSFRPLPRLLLPSRGR